MRRTVLFAALTLAAAGAAAPASAADAPRRAYAPAPRVTYAPAPPAYFEPTPTNRRIVIEKRADRRLTVVDSDGVILERSFVDPEPPRRVETRSYVRDGRAKPFALYGGFFGLDRWGYSRDGW